MTFAGSSRNRGCEAEDQARRYLEGQGLKTIRQNFYSRGGEVDLIMQDSTILVFVEVRFRRISHHGSAAESITPAKQRRIIAAAKYFLHRHRHWDDWPCRFDAVTVAGEKDPQLHWIRDAFRP